VIGVIVLVANSQTFSLVAGTLLALKEFLGLPFFCLVAPRQTRMKNAIVDLDGFFQQSHFHCVNKDRSKINFPISTWAGCQPAQNRRKPT
jgi:hypothetical protein